MDVHSKITPVKITIESSKIQLFETMLLLFGYYQNYTHSTN